MQRGGEDVASVKRRARIWLFRTLDAYAIGMPQNRERVDTNKEKERSWRTTIPKGY